MLSASSGGTVEVGHPHATEPDLRELKASAAKRALSHRFSLQMTSDRVQIVSVDTRMGFSVNLSHGLRGAGEYLSR